LSRLRAMRRMRVASAGEMRVRTNEVIVAKLLLSLLALSH
jgi:hypothetical protein